MDKEEVSIRTLLPVLAFGVSSMLLQITCLRQLLAVFSGNELVIGVIMAVWLTSVGIGSLAGRRFARPGAFAFCLLAGGMLAQPTVLFISLIRPVFGIGFGENISLASTFLLTALSLFSICLITGLQFPVAVSSVRSSSLVYAVEAAGAALGGAVFTFLLAGRCDAPTTAAIAASLNILASALLLRKKWPLLFLAVPLLLLLIAPRLTASFLWKGSELVGRRESRFGEITVFRSHEQFNVYESGKYLFSYPDPQTEELRTHIPMTVHPAPVSVLMLGGSPAGLIPLSAYPGVNVDYVDMDPDLVGTSLRILSPGDRMKTSGKRFRISTTDGRSFVKEAEWRGYDLIIMNIPDPSTASLNRFYTVEFFTEARAALSKGGIISLTLPASSGYVGRRMQQANGSVFNSLQRVFRYVAVSSDEYGYIFGSDEPMGTSPDTLATRFSDRDIKTAFFIPSIFYDAFDARKTDTALRRLKEVTSINTDSRPLAYLYNLMLWAEVHGQFLNGVLGARSSQMMAVLAVTALVAAGAMRGRRRALYFSVFSAGYAAMTLSVVVILACQAAYGYVYEVIGILSASFMLGAAMGGLAGRIPGQPLTLLRLAEAASSLLFLTGAFSMGSPFSFYLLNLLGGFTAGLAFSLACRCIPGDAAMAAGRLYAADLGGSVAGAISASIVLIPTAGIQNTLFSLVFLKALSVFLLVTIRHETH